MIDLKELITKPRRAAASLAELAPWFGLAEDNMVICQDGSLLAGFVFEGMPWEGVDDDVLNQQIELMQRSLRSIGERITMWSYVDRRYNTSYESVPFANPVAKRIDDGWKQTILSEPHATLRHEVYIGYRFDAGSFAFLDAVRHEMDQADTNIFKAIFTVSARNLSAKGTVASVRSRLAEMFADFNQTISGFESIVGPRLGFQRLHGEDLLGSLYSRFNLASPRGPLRVPDRASYLAQAIPADGIVREQDQLRFVGPAKSVYLSALSTTGMPPHNYSFHIDELLSSDCEFSICQTFEFLSTERAKKAIEAAEAYYKMEVKSLGTRVAEKIMKTPIDKVNTGNLHLAADAQEALAELTSSDISYGYYNMTILGLGSTPKLADRAAEILSGSLRGKGYAVTREVNGLLTAFLGTLPGNAKVQLRKYLASTANLADLVPLRSITAGDPHHALFSDTLQRPVPSHIKFLTDWGVPYDFSPHEMDLGHTAIIGGSGAGKTTLMHLMVAQFQKYFPCQAYIFDKDHSMTVLTVLLGGKHIDMATKAGKRVGMNPVRRFLKNGDELMLRRWVEVLITAGDPGSTVSPIENEEIFAAIQSLKGIGETFWRLGQLYTILRGKNPALAMRLAPYVDRSEHTSDLSNRGPFCDFFDNEEDEFNLSSIVGMETGKLLMLPQVASPFMDYAFYCIEARLDGVTPTLIYVEEAWYMLSNPVFAAKMDDWLRTFRKKRAFLVFATQALDEIKQMKSVGAFISNVPTRIFLPSINSSVAANAGLYKDIFSLNDAQLMLLSSAIPKRDYLIVKSSGTKLVKADMPPIIVRINDATSKTMLRERALEMARDGSPGWEEKYLQEELHV